MSYVDGEADYVFVNHDEAAAEAVDREPSELVRGALAAQVFKNMAYYLKRSSFWNYLFSSDDQEQKSPAKKEEINGAPSKSTGPSKSTPPDSNELALESPAAPVSEAELRAFFQQKSPITTLDLVVNFKAKLRNREDKDVFGELLRRISKLQRTNGSSYVVLKEQRGRV